MRYYNPDNDINDLTENMGGKITITPEDLRMIEFFTVERSSIDEEDMKRLNKEIILFRNKNKYNTNEEKENEKEEDIVILEGKLQKKSPWLHYNTRLVIFYSKGHVDYYEPNTKKLKGAFIIDSKCKAIVIDEYRFEINTPKRTYFFKHKTKKVANEWVDNINKYIENLDMKNKK